MIDLNECENVDADPFDTAGVFHDPPEDPETTIWVENLRVGLDKAEENGIDFVVPEVVEWKKHNQDSDVPDKGLILRDRNDLSTFVAVAPFRYDPEVHGDD